MDLTKCTELLEKRRLSALTVETPFADMGGGGDASSSTSNLQLRTDSSLTQQMRATERQYVNYNWHPAWPHEEVGNAAQRLGAPPGISPFQTLQGQGIVFVEKDHSQRAHGQSCYSLLNTSQRNAAPQARPGPRNRSLDRGLPKPTYRSNSSSMARSMQRNVEHPGSSSTSSVQEQSMANLDHEVSQSIYSQNNRRHFDQGKTMEKTSLPQANDSFRIAKEQEIKYVERKPHIPSCAHYVPTQMETKSANILAQGTPLKTVQERIISRLEKEPLPLTDLQPEHGSASASHLRPKPEQGSFQDNAIYQPIQDQDVAKPEKLPSQASLLFTSQLLRDCKLNQFSDTSSSKQAWPPSTNDSLYDYKEPQVKHRSLKAPTMQRLLKQVRPEPTRPTRSPAPHPPSAELTEMMKNMEYLKLLGENSPVKQQGHPPKLSSDCNIVGAMSPQKSNKPLVRNSLSTSVNVQTISQEDMCRLHIEAISELDTKINDKIVVDEQKLDETSSPDEKVQQKKIVPINNGFCYTPGDFPALPKATIGQMMNQEVINSFVEEDDSTATIATVTAANIVTANTVHIVAPTPATISIATAATIPNCSAATTATATAAVTVPAAAYAAAPNTVLVAIAQNASQSHDLIQFDTENDIRYIPRRLIEEQLGREAVLRHAMRIESDDIISQFRNQVTQGGMDYETSCRLQKMRLWDEMVSYPLVYQFPKEIYERLPENPFPMLPDEAFFYMFYAHSHDLTQLEAAERLYLSGWRFHIPLRRWFKQIPTSTNSHFVLTMFDPSKWACVPPPEDLEISEAHFEGRPDVPDRQKAF